MRVVVPYATLYPETKVALESDGYLPEYRYTGATQSAYHETLAELWRAGEAFTVVEQDIVVWPGALAVLEACPEPWCGFAYELSTGYGAYLGCTRFSQALLREHVGVFEGVDHLRPDGTPPRYWGRLDTRLKQVLETEGLRMHIHWPVVGHLNPSQQFIGAFNCGRCGAAIPRETTDAGPAPYPCARCS